MNWIGDRKALGPEVETDRIRRKGTLTGRWRRRGRHATRQGLRFLLVAAVAAAVGMPPNVAASPEFSGWGDPVNLGSVVNSDALDAGAAISKDGLSLYFASGRDGGEGGNDIWVSQRESTDEDWGESVNLGPTVNTDANDGVPDFSRDGHWMFFNSNRGGGSGSFDIWASYREHVNDDFGWEEPVNLGSGVNSASIDQGPAYFEGEDDGVALLYFNSNRAGGLGGLDIYVSEQQDDGSWGAAELVTELSSSAGDLRPAIRHDGLELFLFSGRAGGEGGADIWVSTRNATSDAWGTPVNLGSTVNTAADERQAYISSDRTTLYFTSNREGGEGGDDLYVTSRSKV